jgi:hypothetical protein
VPRRQLLHPRAGAHEHQVGHVHGADEQHEHHAAPEQIEGAAQILDEKVLQRHHDGVEAGVDEDLFQLRKAIEVARVQRVNLLARLFDGRARLQPRDVGPVVAVPLVVGFLLGRERHRQPDLHVGIEEPEVLRQHADNGERLAVDPEIAADGVVLPAEPLLPRRVGQDRFAGLACLPLLLGEETSADRLRLQQAQQRGRAQHRDDPLRLAVAAERHAARVVERLLLEHGRVAQAIVVVRHARRAAGDPGRRVGVEHVDELPGLRNRQRLEQDRIDDREDRGVGAYAEREREDRRGGEAAVLPQQAEAEPYVLQHLLLYGSLPRPVQGTVIRPPRRRL